MINFTEDELQNVPKEVLIKSLNDLLEIIERKNDYITQTEITIDLLNNEIQNLNEEVSSLNEEVDGLMAENDELENDNEELYWIPNSASQT